jgi:hypothetical protein
MLLAYIVSAAFIYLDSKNSYHKVTLGGVRNEPKIIMLT